MGKTIVVLGWTVTALSTLRAVKPLKKLGYEIILAAGSRKSNIALHSNVSDRRLVFEGGLVEGLLRIGPSFPSKPILLLTDDYDVVEISHRREELKQYYNYLLPTHSTVRMLMEKSNFTRFALANDLPIPETIFINSEDDLRNAHERISFPFIVKPYLKHASKVDNQIQIEQLIRRLDRSHYQSAIVQRYVEGEDDNLFFVFLVFDEMGSLIHRMIARKLRQWPISYGTTSLAKTVDNERLWTETEKFIRAVDVVGYCSIEYKYDQITDRFYIMEPTIGRFNQQIALSVSSGVNIPLAMVKLISGETITMRDQKNDVFWIYESNDLLSFFKSKTRYGYLANFLKPSVKVLMDWRDFKPILYEVWMLAGKRIRKILRYA